MRPPSLDFNQEDTVSFQLGESEAREYIDGSGRPVMEPAYWSKISVRRAV